MARTMSATALSIEEKYQHLVDGLDDVQDRLASIRRIADDIRRMAEPEPAEVTCHAD